jgi:phage tail sheath gpL-like
MTIVLASLSADDKVPGVYQENLYGQGVGSVGDEPRYVVCTGNKTSAGSWTADSYVGPVYSTAEAAAGAGAGSELYLQLEAALETGAAVYAAPVAEAQGAAAGTLTVTLTAPSSGTGQISLDIGDETVSFVLAAGGLEAGADALVAAVNAKSRLFCTAAKGAGPGFVVTLTTKSKGVRANNWYVRADLSLAAATSGCALSGGTPTSSGLVPFSGGSGSDDASNVIALLKSREYFRIAAAQNDATNAARWEAHVDAEADPLIEHLEQVVFGHNGTTAAATTLAQSTLNAYLCQLVYCRYSRKHPAQIAARVAGIRCVAESQNPWTRYDGKFNDAAAVLWTNVPQLSADILLHSEEKALLNAGVTPVTTMGGDLRIVRSICSHSLNGSDPDYRCLDTKDVSVPQRVREELAVIGASFIEQNPGAGPDLPDGLPSIAGVGTPQIFGALAVDLAREIERRGWLTAVSTNLPAARWNASSHRIETTFPCIVTPHQHQLVNSIRQVAA